MGALCTQLLLSHPLPDSPVLVRGGCQPSLCPRLAPQAAQQVVRPCGGLQAGVSLVLGQLQLLSQGALHTAAALLSVLQLGLQGVSKDAEKQELGTALCKRFTPVLRPEVQPGPAGQPGEMVLLAVACSRGSRAKRALQAPSYVLSMSA